MAKKRSYSEVEPSGNAGASDERRPGPQKHWSKRPKVDVSEENLGAIKKRARAIERLLAREDLLKLPANKQEELKRELGAHRQRIVEAKAKKHRSYMIGKYHMVRFFGRCIPLLLTTVTYLLLLHNTERQKAARLVKQLRRRLGELEDVEEIAKTKADLHIAEVDVDYAIYYPFLEPYVSLYASGESKGEKATAAQFLHAPRPPMWAEIEKVRESGKAALQKVQNRQAEISTEPISKDPTRAGQEERRLGKGRVTERAKQTRRQEQSAREEEEDGNASDGFFTED